MKSLVNILGLSAFEAPRGMSEMQLGKWVCSLEERPGMQVDICESLNPGCG